MGLPGRGIGIGPGRSLIAAVLAAGLTVGAACGPRAAPRAEPAPGATPAIKERPRSTATIAISEPAAGAVITGERLRVRLNLAGGHVILETRTTLTPDEGHIHLLLDGKLVSMTYGTEQDIPVTKGTHILQAEFVAADHFPFNPRVIALTTVIVQ